MFLNIATLDTGSTGFMLLATSLVMLMTPGLAFFYGGLATKRNIPAIMIQSFVSLGWTTVLWVVIGYSLCFSGGEGGIIGNFDKAMLSGISIDTLWAVFEQSRHTKTILCKNFTSKAQWKW